MTNRSQVKHSLGPSEMETLKNAIWPVKEILELDGRFQKKDAVKAVGQDVNVRLWTVNGGWRVVDTTSPNPSDTKINVYRWNDGAKAVLEDYVEQQPKLPCPNNHRAHVYNDPKVSEDSVGCRFCAENGTHPEISKETVKQIL